jgi:hypothetical protein
LTFQSAYKVGGIGRRLQAESADKMSKKKWCQTGPVEQAQAQEIGTGPD